MNKPVLVTQTRRLGDLILTFPLLIDLQKRFPDHPIWVVAEPAFFNGLMEFSPNVVFFPAEHMPVLAKEKYEGIFNFSSGLREASFTAEATANFKYGQYATPDGMRVAGFWQLYRAALTLNNRHNVFHWADLNRMDLGLPLLSIDVPPRQKSGQKRIGLFVGASEIAKRPEAPFWIELATSLVKNRYKPVFLGGNAEKQAGEYISSKARLPGANFCGKTSLNQLAGILSTLDLFITPDTGPMHLASWLGIPTLNLSMGNVNAAETGPMSAHQLVLRARMSCYGCWKCHRQNYYCRQKFNPRIIGELAHNIIAGNKNLPALLPGNLELLTTGKDPVTGLSQLDKLAQSQPSLRDYLDTFWKNAFLHASGSALANLENATAALCQAFPAIAQDMRTYFGKSLAMFSLAAKKGQPLPDTFWSAQPWHFRLYAGYLQTSLQNDNFSRPSLLKAINEIAALEELFSRNLSQS